MKPEISLNLDPKVQQLLEEIKLVCPDAVARIKAGKNPLLLEALKKCNPVPSGKHISLLNSTLSAEFFPNGICQFNDIELANMDWGDSFDKVNCYIGVYKTVKNGFEAELYCFTNEEQKMNMVFTEEIKRTLLFFTEVEGYVTTYQNRELHLNLRK